MTMRSPSKCGGSYPNLSTTCEQDIEAGFVNFRKRKQPEDEDCFTEAIERLTRNLNGSISSLRDEMNSKLESFTSDINTIVTTEMNNFRTLIDEMKNEVTDIKVACSLPSMNCTPSNSRLQHKSRRSVIRLILITSVFITSSKVKRQWSMLQAKCRRCPTL